MKKLSDFEFNIHGKNSKKELGKGTYGSVWLGKLKSNN